MKNKKISLKASSLAVLTGVLSTASVISIAATSFNKNVVASNVDNTKVATNNATTVAASNQTSPISTTGVKAKIISRNIARTTENVKVYKTDLNLRYDKYGFKYPAVNYTYSDKRNSTMKDGVNVVDFAHEVMTEKVLLDYGNGTNSIWTGYNDARYINSYLSKNKHYKHPAADGLYINKISDVKAVEKQFNVKTSLKGSISLGLFAAPGEPFTFTFDTDTFNTLEKYDFKGLEVIVNENNFESYNSVSSTSVKVTTRYPHTKTTFAIEPKKIDKKTKSVTFESPFGGMISLNVKSRLFDQNIDLMSNNSNWVNFKVSGALETLQYIEGETTSDEWQEQINRIKDGSMYASAISLVGEFGSAIIPATGNKEFGGIKVDDIVYPEAVMKKWSDLGFLGAYLSGRDSSNEATRISYNFSNDSYWGGGVTSVDKTSFYAPIKSGGEAFLIGADSFGSTKSQEVLNGLGLDYKQDKVLFSGSKISKSNQATLPLLGILDDYTKARNTVGVYGDSSSFQDAYQTINKIKNKQGNDETSIYTLLLYTVGPKNYIDYMRSAAQSRSGSKTSLTPMQEIEAMSDFFGLNLYQAFVNSNSTWSGGWPKSYSSATKEEKAIIDKLQNKYPAMDFVANMYASGNYLLNNGSKTSYTGDYAPAYEVPAGEDYVFDFGKYINWTSKSFNWSKLSVSTKSSAGVELQVDKKDSKKVIYKGSTKFAADDEFLVTIYPNFKNNKLNNYVPSYIWKIKVKQVTSSALVSTYKSKTASTATDLLSKIKTGTLKNITLANESYDLYSNKNNYFTNEKNTAVRYRFKFVAPEDGRYIFSNIYSDSISVYANGEEVYHDNKASSTFKNTIAADLYKGKTIDFDILVSSTSGVGNFGMDVDYSKNFGPSPIAKTTKVDLWSNIAVQNIDKVQTLAAVSSLTEFTKNQKYVYKPRSVNYFTYDSNAIYRVGATEFDYSVINTNLYEYTNAKNVTVTELNKLNSQSSNFEVWNKKYIQFDVKFTRPTKVSSLVFSHRLDNHLNSRPKYIDIEATTKSGKKVRLFNGMYGEQFNDKNTAWSGLNFSGNEEYEKLSFYISAGNSKSIVLRKLYISSAKFYPTNNWSTYKSLIFNKK